MDAISNTKRELDEKKNCNTSKVISSYRGFSSIDQEIEREIAMQWFSSTGKITISQRNFLFRKEIL